MKPTIRPLTPLDKDQYIVLMEMFFRERLARDGVEFDPQSAAAHFDHFIGLPGLIGLVAEDADGICGALVAVTSAILFCKGVCAQEMVWYVNPEKRGYGVRMLHAFEQEAVARGCDSLMMVGMWGDPSNEFYLKSGYRPMQTSYFKKAEA